MSVVSVDYQELERMVRAGEQLFFFESILDARMNQLIGTEKVITLKDLERIKERNPERIYKPFKVRKAVVHFIEEEKRIKWAAYIISCLEGYNVLKDIHRTKKEFISKYIKSYIVDQDYLIYKIAQLKNASPLYFEHTLNTSFIALALFQMYAEEKLGGMIDANEVGKVISAATLHCVGVMQLPPEMLKKRYYEMKDNNEFFQYPILSFKILKAEKDKHDLSDEVMKATLCVEERIDGSGKPRGVGDNDLSFLDRLIQISSFFEWLTRGELSLAKKPYREYVNLIKLNSKKFDPVFLNYIDNHFKYLYNVLV